MRRQLVTAAVAILAAGCTSTVSPPLPASTAPGPSVTVPPGWTRTLVPALDGISTIGRIGAGPSGFVALADFSAWHSTDGVAWSSVKIGIDQPRAVRSNAQGHWVAAGWHQLSAAPAESQLPGAPASQGTCPRGPLVGAQFATSDDGVTWTPATPLPAFETYFVGELAVPPNGVGYMAVGSNSCSEGLPPASLSWGSFDGKVWDAATERVSTGLMLGAEFLRTGAVVAVGVSSDDTSAPADALAWILTPTARIWSKPTVVAAGGGPLSQVVVVNDAAYAWGPGSSHVYRSTDGVTWSALPFPGDHPDDLVSVGTGSTAWLAGCSSAGIVGLTPAGTWVPIAGEPDNIRALAAGPSGLLAIGSTTDGHGVVWQGPATLPGG